MVKRQRIAIITSFPGALWDPFSIGAPRNEETLGMVRYCLGRPDWDVVGFGVPLPPSKNLLN